MTTDKVKAAKQRIKASTQATNETYLRPWYKYWKTRLKKFIKKIWQQI